MTTITPNALCFGDEFPAAGAPCLVHVEEHGLTITLHLILPMASRSPFLFQASPFRQADSTMTSLL